MLKKVQNNFRKLNKDTRCNSPLHGNLQLEVSSNSEMNESAESRAPSELSPANSKENISSLPATEEVFIFISYSSSSRLFLRSSKMILNLIFQKRLCLQELSSIPNHLMQQMTSL